VRVECNFIEFRLQSYR